MKQLTTLLILFLTCGFGFGQTNALDFDGSNDYVSSDVLGPIGSEARTIEAWIKTTGASSSQQIITEYGGGAASMRFTFKTQLGKLRIETGGTGNFLETTASIPYNTWVHVAVTFDPLATNQYALFINGVFQVSGNFTDPTATSTSPTLQIGARAANVTATKFNGLIDELRIWDYARTEAEISANMDNEFCTLPTGLVSYFKFNEGVAGGNNSAITTIADEVNPGATNTLVNFSLTSSTFSNFLTGIVDSNDDLVVIPATSCTDYLWTENNQTYATSGQYDIVLTNSLGCDSVRRLDLTIHTIDNGITDNANGTLTANMPGVSYQWLDCDNNNSPLNGMTSQTIIVPSPGNYAVELNNNGCLDTSNCLNISSIPSYINPAMQFDGSNDFIQTTTTGVSGNQARTVEAWVNIPSSNTTSQHTIVDWGGLTAGSRFTTNILNQKLRLEINGAGVNGTTLLNDGLWHHIATTYDPADNDTVRIYVDGIEEGKLRMATINTQNVNVTIGTRFDNANYFFGEMDEVRIWSVAKSQAEIVAGMNSPICTVDTDLISLFTFNEGTPFGNNVAITTLKDYAALTETSVPENFTMNGTNSNFSIGPNIDHGMNFTSMNDAACDSYYWTANSTTYNASGEYFYTLTGSNLCDSIVKLNLTINTIDNTVTDNANSTLFANMSGATYTWLDCDNNNTPVLNATNQLFIASTVGNYAVEISANGCVDTSDCIVVSSIPDFVNAAMHFDGDEDYISTDFPGIIGNNPITVEAMVKTDAINNEQVITAWGSDASNGNRFTFRINHVGGTYVPRIEIKGGGLDGAVDLNDGMWHHVAVTYDPALASNKYKLFVDGVLDTEGDIAQALNIVQDVNMNIGRRINPTFTGYFSGAMDEIRVWNVAKSEAELLAGKNGEVCSQAPELVAYFNLNEGTPGANNTNISTVLDNSGNNIVGTPNSFTLSGNASNYVLGPVLNAGMQIIETDVFSCGDYLWAVDNATYTMDGTYTGITSNMNGCDSIVTMNLTIYPASGSTFVVENCGPYTWPLTGNTHSLTGFYNTTLQNIHGCDSMVTLALTVHPAINGATNNAGTLSATTSGANYQWINCADNSEINGATNQTFVPTTGGSYAVIVDNGTCVDTSVCMSVAIAGIDENNMASVLIFPNPVQGELTVQLSSLEDGALVVRDVHGKMIKEISFNAVQEIVFDMSEQKSGVYFVEIDTDSNSFKSRIIVK